MNDISKEHKEVAKELLKNRQGQGEAKLGFQTDAVAARSANNGFSVVMSAPNVFILVNSLESKTYNLENSLEAILIGDYDYTNPEPESETHYNKGTLKTHVIKQEHHYDITIDIDGKYQGLYHSELKGTVKVKLPK
ncbi:hypothetical protein [Pseudomonas sp. 6D_7.1_Bac1]|uniref:hypothetical protein n=1 Tax=Pseudomonas sp. 6D_7.1_Bac1 TaxID=2971615 RepID=UPI0021C5CAF3|nr:hypothetical protein [Pseudomonas sp. 6D_7.1_Bac1]MCU1750398.1 hypothetical protein [Pseudomonas sp. 6D_7.1_Bac1]